MDPDSEKPHFEITDRPLSKIYSGTGSQHASDQRTPKFGAAFYRLMQPWG
jgi:hypothetical protein